MESIEKNLIKISWAIPWGLWITYRRWVVFDLISLEGIKDTLISTTTLMFQMNFSIQNNLGNFE